MPPTAVATIGLALPHRLGDGEAEALGEALLGHDRRVALDRVDDGSVLVGVAHRDAREVDAGALGVGRARATPRCTPPAPRRLPGRRRRPSRPVRPAGGAQRWSRRRARRTPSSHRPCPSCGPTGTPARPAVRRPAVAGRSGARRRAGRRARVIRPARVNAVRGGGRRRRAARRSAAPPRPRSAPSPGSSARTGRSTEGSRTRARRRPTEARTPRARTRRRRHRSR